MPPKYAPMLQPNARRAPYPINRPPMTDAMKLPLVILVNLNSPPAAEAKNAPSMTAKLRTVVESAGIDHSNARAACPCQQPRLAASHPIAAVALEPHSAKAEVAPHGSPRVSSVKACNPASATAAGIQGQEPLKILFQP